MNRNSVFTNAVKHKMPPNNRFSCNLVHGDYVPFFVPEFYNWILTSCQPHKVTTGQYFCQKIGWRILRVEEDVWDTGPS